MAYITRVKNTINPLYNKRQTDKETFKGDTVFPIMYEVSSRSTYFKLDKI